MEQDITAIVFRYDAESGGKPRYDEYRVDAAEEMTVLVLLNTIQQKMDPTLGFRSYCCGLQLCRSCVMKVNHKKQLACIIRVKPGERVIIEPESFPERHIRDLVVFIKDEE